MATLGLDTSVYEQGIEEAKAKTKESVSVMAKDYSRLYSEVLHLQAAYKKSVEETGKNSQATKDLKVKLSEAQAQLNSTSSALETAEKYMNSFGDAASGSSKSLAGAIAQGTIMAGFFLKTQLCRSCRCEKFNPERHRVQRPNRKLPRGSNQYAGRCTGGQ